MGFAVAESIDEAGAAVEALANWRNPSTAPVNAGVTESSAVNSADTATTSFPSLLSEAALDSIEYMDELLVDCHRDGEKAFNRITSEFDRNRTMADE